jgi:hypothetical protein
MSTTLVVCEVVDVWYFGNLGLAKTVLPNGSEASRDEVTGSMSIK